MLFLANRDSDGPPTAQQVRQFLDYLREHGGYCVSFPLNTAEHDIAQAARASGMVEIVNEGTQWQMFRLPGREVPSVEALEKRYDPEIIFAMLQLLDPNTDLTGRIN